MATTEKVIELEAGLAQEMEGVIVLPGVQEVLSSIQKEDWTINTAGTNAMATTRLQQFNISLPNEMATGDKVLHALFHITFTDLKTKVNLWQAPSRRILVGIQNHQKGSKGLYSI